VPEDGKRAKLTLALLLLVLVGLAAHWYLGPFAPSLSHPDLPTNGSHEMTIVPSPGAPQPGGEAQPAAGNLVNGEALPPIEGDLGPDIVEVEEGEAP
jgi:hypothetical protein